MKRLDAAKIGARIRSTREELGYTQEDLAKGLGFNKSTIQRYESGGIKKIKIPVIQAIATTLNVNPEWLLYKSDKKEPDISYSTDSDSDMFILHMYKRLDLEDRAEIRGEIKHMLKASKYNNSETAEKQPERKPFSRHTVSSDDTSDNTKRKPFSGPRPARIAAYGHEVTGVDSSNNKK